MDGISPPLLNPDTPLAHLPPEAAHQLEIYRYVLVATAGMFTWEVAQDLFNIYSMLCRHPLRFPTFPYILSRICTLGAIIGAVFQAALQVGSCQASVLSVGIFYTFAASCTSLLFFLRVTAIFRNHRLIIGFFSFLWVAVLASSIVVPFAISRSATHIADTNYCIQNDPRPFGAAPFISIAVFDTLVFLFISFRLVTTFAYDERDPSSSMQNWRAFWRAFRGKNIPAFSRAVLQSGQQYYLVAVISNVTTVAMYFSHATGAFRVMLTMPNLAIVNAMACRVYGEIRRGRISTTVHAETADLKYRRRTGADTYELSPHGRHGSRTASILSGPAFAQAAGSDPPFSPRHEYISDTSSGVVRTSPALPGVPGLRSDYKVVDIIRGHGDRTNLRRSAESITEESTDKKTVL